jgi:hypothetical protein
VLSGDAIQAHVCVCATWLECRPTPQLLLLFAHRLLQAYDSPLAVTIAAGSVALPPLLKLTTMMQVAVVKMPAAWSQSAPVSLESRLALWCAV